MDATTLSPRPPRTRPGTRVRQALVATVALTVLTALVLIAVGSGNRPDGPDGPDGARALTADAAPPSTTPAPATPDRADPGPATPPPGDGGAPDGGTTTPDEADDAAPGDGEDDDMPDVPEDGDGEDPGPWIPPTAPVDDFAPTPRVFDLVTPVDPELGPGGSQQGGGGTFSNGPVQCDGHCIEWATVTPGGRSATFRLHTSVPARLWVSTDAPAVQDSTSRVQDWEVTFEGLEPGTLYNVVLVAEDRHGNTDHRYGQFRTLERRVEIAFTSIDVVNDADRWDVNKGEVEWFFAVGGDWIEDFHRGIAKVKSGRSIHLGEDRRLVVEGAGRHLDLAVQGVEHDPGFCPAGIPPFADDFGGDIADCRDVATAFATIDLDDLHVDDPALPSGGHDAVFRLTTAEHYLKFDVYGTIDVDYV
ncbi:MAG: hypothetical protein AB7L84_06270 [Acidimicrobiia bacterium]